MKILIILLWFSVVNFSIFSQSFDIVGGDEPRCHTIEYSEVCDEIFTDETKLSYEFSSYNKCMKFLKRNIENSPGSWQDIHCTVSFIKYCEECKSSNTNQYNEGPSSGCASRSANLQKLSAKRIELDNASKASRLFFESALSIIDQIDCGVYIKDVNCIGNNCEVRWFSEDEEIDPIIAKYSVDKFNQLISQEINKKKERERVSQEFGETLVGIISILIKEMNEKSVSVSNNPFDNDQIIQNLSLRDIEDTQNNNIPESDVNDKNASKASMEISDTDDDGYPDLISITYPEGLIERQLYIDSDKNGEVDIIVDIDKVGNKTYRTVPENGNGWAGSLEGKATQLDETDWGNWKNSLDTSEGEDGYLTVVKPNTKDIIESNRSVYAINGIMTSYNGGLENAQEISNILQEDVISIYSESATNSNSSGVLSFTQDLAMATGMSMSDFLTEGGVTLASGMTIDLMSGKEVIVFAHSRGAALTYNTVTVVSDFFIFQGLEDKLENLTVITLGGYSPPPEKWANNIRLRSHINDGDPVPLLRNNSIGQDGIIPESHFFVNYLRYINLYRQ